MRISCSIFVLLALGMHPACAGLTSLGEHVDIQCHYDPSLDAWTCRGLTEGPGATQIPWNFDDICLPLSDHGYDSANPSDSGARSVQPALGSYAFTGIPAGNPIWLAVQGNPGIGEAWPGFQNGQPAGTLGEYIETDPRLSQPQTLARPWIKVSLKAVSYQGIGTNPAFSLWTVSGSTPRVWMATADGVGASDFFLYSAGSHVHLNWGFGETGIYRLRFAATAFRGPGKTNPTSESAEFTLTFAVGPVANWQAANFNALELDNPETSALRADPDGDGLANLQEYAFGLDPRSGSAVPASSGLGLPRFSVESDGGIVRLVMEYARRKSADFTRPLAYVPGFSDLPSGGTWSPAAPGAESVTEFTGDQAGLNDTWEKVRVTREAAPGQTAGFARVFLEQQP